MKSVQATARAAGPENGSVSGATGITTRLGSRRALGDVTNVAARERRGLADKPAGARAPAAAAGAGAVAAPVRQVPMADISPSREPEARTLRVDEEDAGNPQCFVEYVNDMHEHHREVEASKCASPQYMTHQTDVNERMRSILIDWLVEVHAKFRLKPETLYLTINLIDRFLERKLVVRQKLQLVGVTAMLIASKYEEIFAPEVRDFVYITDRAYTRDQIMHMESCMLNALRFRITTPTAYVFVQRYLRVARASRPTRYLAHFLLERTLQEYSMLQHLPSMVAAAAVNMALRSTDAGASPWTGTMQSYTRYSQDDLRDCIIKMQEFAGAASAASSSSSSSLRAVYKKYSARKYEEAARIPVSTL